MYGCEVVWGDEYAGKVQRIVEDACGGVCPCKAGRSCPMLPTEVKLPMPRVGQRIILGADLCPAASA